MEGRVVSVEGAIAEVMEVKAGVLKRKQEVCAEIGERFEAVIAAAQRRRAELRAECDAFSDGKVERLDDQHRALQASLEAMQAGCALAREAIERGAADPARTLYARGHLVAVRHPVKRQICNLGPPSCLPT